MPVKRLGALAEPDFRNLYFARAFSLIGDGIVPVALAFGVLQTDNSATALGTVLAARSRTLVTFLLIGGVIADRLPRRSLMIGSDVLRLIAQAATAAILISRTAKVWEIAALAVVYGFGNAFFLPTSTGIIPQTVSPERLGWRAFRSRRWLRSAPSRPLLAAMIPPVLLALPTGLLAIPAPTAVIAVGAFAGGFGLAIFNTLFETTVQQNIPPSLLSRVAAIDWMLSASLLPLGQALADPVSAIVGIRAIFVFSAAWIVVSTVAILAVPDIREFRNATAVSRDAGESAPQDVRSGPDSS